MSEKKVQIMFAMGQRGQVDAVQAYVRKKNSKSHVPLFEQLEILGAAVKNDWDSVVRLLCTWEPRFITWPHFKLSGTFQLMGPSQLVGPLQLAIAHGSEKTIQTLRDMNAQHDANDLHVACAHRQHRVVTSLLRGKASVNARASGWSWCSGGTPLHVACMHGDQRTAVQLVRAKADLLKYNGLLHTPYTVAFSHGHVRLARTLRKTRKHGIDEALRIVHLEQEKRKLEELRVESKHVVP